MQNQKCSLDLYTEFLVASQRQFSGSELARTSPEPIAHDSVSRWLSSEKLTPKLLWQECQHMVSVKTGYLVIDDVVFDKLYARKIALAKKQYSGKHHKVVNGIDSVNIVWTNGKKIVPVDYRIYDPTRDGKTKNDHAKDMLYSAYRRGFKPKYVLMDAWYTSIDNLKDINKKGWKWIGALKHNRLVSIERNIYIHVSELDWTSKQVRKVWLKEYGFVLVSKTVAPNGDVTYIATNDLSLYNSKRLKTHFSYRWTIETFHRGIKQCCGVERCYSTLERSQRNHILCAFLAFIRLEEERIQNAISWYEYKLSIARTAITAYLGANA